MGTQDDLGSLVDGVVNGRKSAANARVIRDMTGLIERHIEVGANNDAPIFQGEILNRDFIAVHAEEGSTPGRHELEQVPDAAGIAPLIVVPGDDLNQAL